VTPPCDAGRRAGEQHSVREFPLGHHQVMGLVVRALHHDAHEPKRPGFDALVRIARGDEKLYAVP
jgi:hypothetical protein